MPHTLLLADDSVTIQRVIELTFADEDVRVIAVGDGRHAIERISHEPPEIVLADIGMPGSDGYEVAAFVKSRPDLAHIPVLLLTGAFEPVDEARVREVGAAGVLAKPFEPQELITRVKALLGVARPQAEATPGTAAGHAEAAVEAAAGPVGGPLIEEAGSPLPPPSPRGGVSLDDYFDRLDAAFASLSVPSHLEEAAGVPPPSAELQWHGHEPGPVTSPGPHAGLAAPAAGSPSQQTAAAPAPVVTAATAFAAILDAELSGRPVSDVAPRTAGLAAPPAYPPVEDLVERVARRVIEQLADQSLRDTVADAVSTTAERLVREEIERLKATMQ